jgi:hypothetical protein
MPSATEARILAALKAGFGTPTALMRHLEIDEVFWEENVGTKTRKFAGLPWRIVAICEVDPDRETAGAVF